MQVYYAKRPRTVVRWAQGSLTSLPSNRQQHHAAQEQAEANWRTAVHAAELKKAYDLLVLDLRDITSFTDFFLICSVNNSRQGHAVCDEIRKQLKEIGELPVNVEGYERAEWILMDYGDFLVHIFIESARTFYALERLWSHAKPIAFEQAGPPAQQIASTFHAS
jgi:ribosome-associated protein